MNKPLLALRLIPLLFLSASACTSPSAQSRAGTTTAREPARNQTQSGPIEVAAADDFSSAPPTVFTPQAHGMHGALAPQFADLRTLPALVVRTRSCYGAPVYERPYPGPPGYGVGSGARSGGSGAKSSPAPRPSAPHAGRMPSKAGNAPGDALSGSLDGSGSGRAAPPAASPPTPPPMTAAPKGEKKDSGPSAGRAPAVNPRPAPAPAPEPDYAASESGADESFGDREAERAAPVPPPEVARDQYHDWGAKIYLSNDDSMSLSSAQRVIYAIDRFLPIPEEHVRPHELLNYFSFDTAPIARSDDFSVHAEIQPKPGAPGAFTLGFSVSGRDVTNAERRNAALTFVIDRSGSMQDEGRMNYLKRGLARMTAELKNGDLVNLVLFDDEVCVPVENFVVGRDPMSTLTQAISKLEPRGSTDVNLGLQKGYKLADNAYRATHNNRVVLITDALANTGVTDESMIAVIGKHYDERRIRLSGVGVGSDFNDSLLDRLTERGKGAYVFLGSEAEVDAVFGSRFNSLIETIANDVHFRMHLPPSLGLDVFYGEESSTVKEDVQAIHYFAGTSQMFLSDVSARGGRLRGQDSVMLSVEYENPETGTEQAEEFAFNLGQIAEQSRNVRKARLIISFIDGLRDTLGSVPDRREYRAKGWRDPSAAEQCARGKVSLDNQAQSLGEDPEVRRVLKLWDTYCSRYEVVEPPRQPMRREPPRGEDVWPSAER